MLNIKDELIKEHLSKLGATPFAVLAVLSKYMNKNGKAWPATSTIERLINIKETARKNATRKLEKLEYITRYRRTNKEGKYIGIGYQVITPLVTRYNGPNPSDGKPSVEKQPMDDLSPSDGKPSVEKQPMDGKPSDTYPSVVLTIGGKTTDISITNTKEVLYNSIKALLKEKEEEQSSPDLSKQIVSLKNKIQQLEEQNKKLAQRLIEQPVNQNTEEAKKPDPKKLPYLEEYKILVEWINFTCKRKLPVFEDPKRIKQDYKYKDIIARLRKGSPVDEMKRVVKMKSNEWLNSKHMKKSLNTSTLFGNKYERYRDDLSDQASDTPIKDGYAPIKKYIEDNEITPEELYDMSNNLGKYKKTQP